VCASRLTPHLDRVLAARGWQDRQQHLAHAYQIIAAMHNDLGITEPLSAHATQFHGRPFLVIEAGRFADALRNQIRDKRVRNLPEAIGSIDQYVDSTDVLSNPTLRRRAKAIYGSIYDGASA
jgi:zona occludens toxin (predicted ATPase)